MGIMPDSLIRERAPDHGGRAPLAAARSCRGVISTAERAGETMGQKGAALAKL